MSKKILITGILIIIGILLAASDFLALVPADATISQVTAIQFFYFFPSIIYIVFALTATQYGRRSLAPEERTEKIKSFVRSGIQIIGTIIGLSAAFNLNIPFINELRSALDYVFENIDIAANAILALIGIITTIIGFFKDPTRFSDRADQVEGKELKV